MLSFLIELILNSVYSVKQLIIMWACEAFFHVLWMLTLIVFFLFCSIVDQIGSQVILFP